LALLPNANAEVEERRICRATKCDFFVGKKLITTAAALLLPWGSFQLPQRAESNGLECSAVELIGVLQPG